MGKWDAGVPRRKFLSAGGGGGGCRYLLGNGKQVAELFQSFREKKKEIAQSRNWQPLIPFIRAGKYFSPMFKRRERLAIAKSDENNFQR